MTTWFVSCHPGAPQCSHLDSAEVSACNTLIAPLPVHLAAGVYAAGARHINLSLDFPTHVRGKKLTAEELSLYLARPVENSIKNRPPAQKPDE